MLFINDTEEMWINYYQAVDGAEQHILSDKCDQSIVTWTWFLQKCNFLFEQNKINEYDHCRISQ